MRPAAHRRSVSASVAEHLALRILEGQKSTSSGSGQLDSNGSRFVMSGVRTCVLSRPILAIDNGLESSNVVPMEYVIIAAHKSSFPDPVRSSPGDRLVLGKKDEEYPGWIWVTIPSGLQGWAPESLIRFETEKSGVALEEYTARELDTTEGEHVRCTRELAGWLWVENVAGQTGWIPKKSALAME